MIKVARKSSSDPIQEKLREEKSLWNKEVSSFINDLIHFKKNMNGWPSKYFPDKSSIKDPIPANPATIISNLSSRYSKIIQLGNEIVKQQLEYSKSRKKQQVKQLSLPFITSDVKQNFNIKNSESFYNLTTEASNPFSRLFTRLVTPTWGSSNEANIRKYRMSLLKTCAKIYKELGKFQAEVVGRNNESIISSNKILHKTYNDWLLVCNFVIDYKKNISKDEKNTDGNIKSKNKEDSSLEEMIISDKPSSIDKPQPGDFDHEPKDGEGILEELESTKSNVILEAQQAIKDFFNTRLDPQSNLLITDPNMFNNLIDLDGRFKMAKSNEDKQKIATKIVMEHRTILHKANKKFNVVASSLDELLKAIIAKNNITTAYIQSSNLEKVAQDFIKKWVGKKINQYSSDANAPFRLEMFEKTNTIREDLNKLMDLLEKDININDIDPIVCKIHKNMMSIKKVIRYLNFGAK